MVQYSKTKIINLARVTLGYPPLEVTNNNSDEASKLLEFLYEDVLNDLYLNGNWNFASLVVDLVQTIPVPKSIEGFSYAFNLPSDLISIIAVKGKPQYKILGNVLLTSCSSIRIQYVRRVLEKDFPYFFVKAVYLELAKRASFALNKNNIITQILVRDAENALRIARVSNSQEMPAETLSDSELEMSRFDYGT